MMNQTLETTTDTLYQGRITLQQPRHGYRFGTDAMQLAGLINPRAGEHLLELGSGVGAVTLALAWRAQQQNIAADFTGIELQEVLAELAVANAATNKLNARFVQGDITDKNLFNQLGRFDQVLCNPPFHPEGQSSPAGNAIKTTAHIEIQDGLQHWLKAANRFLKPKGIFTMIHRADRLGEILSHAAAFLGAIEIIPFWPKDGEPARRVIVRGVKGSRKPLVLHPGIVVHDGDGNYSAVADGIINQGHVGL
jgi:tRNA1(Val) A37 N6-methylase TrmN6